MKAAAYLGKREIRIVEVPVPKVVNDGVLVKMKACGICGTDMHVYKSGIMVEDSTKLIDGYRIIGHEFSGEIVDKGKGVSRYQVGDSVASVHNKGGMAEYIEIHGESLKNLFTFPRGVSFITTATLEPLCNPLHSYYLQVPRKNEIVAIFGAGIIGLGYLQIVKHKTEAETIVVDVSDLRLEKAKRIGATHVINALHEDPVQKIKRLTGEYSVRYHKESAGRCDITIDCAGLPLTFRQCLELVKPQNGTMIIAALYEKSAAIDPNTILLKYMSVLGSMGYLESETREALDLIVQEKIDRGMLVTHQFPLEKVEEAFSKQGNPEESVKVMLTS